MALANSPIRQNHQNHQTPTKTTKTSNNLRLSSIAHPTTSIEKKLKQHTQENIKFEQEILHIHQNQVNLNMIYYTYTHTHTHVTLNEIDILHIHNLLHTK